MQTLFNWAVSEGLVTENPVLRIKPPKEPKRVIKALTNEEISRILAVLGRNFEGIRNKALILLLLDTGLRLGEVTGITMDSIDFDQQVITVLGKGAKERRVRFGSRTAKALWHYLALRNRISSESKALWLTRQGEALTANAIALVLKRIGQKTGIKVHAHKLRHTFAIMMLRNGTSPFEVQYLLGHSTLEMTRRYCQSLGFDDAYKSHKKASPVDNLGMRRV